MATRERETHSEVTVPQVESYEQDDYIVKNFEVRWDAPYDEGALFKAVGKWLKKMREEHKHLFDLHGLHGNGNFVTVLYRVREAAKDTVSVDLVAPAP